MIIVTGGCGFIGSNLVNALCYIYDKVIICDFKKAFRKEYFNDLSKIELIEPKHIFEYTKTKKIRAIFHLGAISSTTASDGNKVWLNNIYFSTSLWQLCVRKKIRYIYASSAATYGDGEYGFNDSYSLKNLSKIKPLNIYGWSKKEVDLRNFISSKFHDFRPPQWVGLKFFNVFGPNESHKKDMSSIVWKTYLQIKTQKETKLFKSYKKNYKDGEQKRDFIYVKDCIKVMLWLLNNENVSGIFNVGTGISRTFLDLVAGVYRIMSRNVNLSFIDMPPKIKRQYQYETKANISNLRKVGYKNTFYTLEEGIEDYINNLC